MGLGFFYWHLPLKKGQALYSRFCTSITGMIVKNLDPVKVNIIFIHVRFGRKFEEVLLSSIQISEQERILCIPIGTGAMDIAVSAVALQKAEEEGLGGSYDFTA